jgi:hypothetical protein
MLWFSSTESPRYLAAKHRLDVCHADLARVKVDLSRTLERKARAEHNLDLLDETLSYLRRNASVVGMKEFEKIRFQRASELGTIITDSRTIPQLETHIKIIQAEIDRITGDLPSLKSKVLEFKKRD